MKTFEVTIKAIFEVEDRSVDDPLVGITAKANNMATQVAIHNTIGAEIAVVASIEELKK